MGKVYRLHKDGGEGTGWFVSQPITDKQLESIRTDGKEVATSIPTPFAQIDLVKSAFKWAADNGIEGNTAQHKLVSYALDVAQLFFQYPKFQNKLRIISWSPEEAEKAGDPDENEMDEATLMYGNPDGENKEVQTVGGGFKRIKQSYKRSHQSLARTLKIFWDADAGIYNFDKLKRFYFLLDNSTNRVIGSTSPASLFMSAPDAEKIAAGKLAAGSQVMFGETYYSLAKRDKAFIKYMYLLMKQNGFTDHFKEVHDYLKACKEKLDDGVVKVISNLSDKELSQYEKCLVLHQPNNKCEILGVELGVQGSANNEIQQFSDFVISCDRSPGEVEHLPLILPFDKFSSNWVYTLPGNSWEITYNIPYKNQAGAKDSVLPVVGDKYYWLTVGNFLEDKLIELPYRIDRNKFITCGSDKYLLPLSPLFFEYFEARKAADFLTFNSLAGGGVEVKLSIPVKKGNIIYKKTYHQKDIITCEIHVGILPFIRLENTPMEYTLGLLDDRLRREDKIKLECLSDGKKIPTGAAVTRNSGRGGELQSEYYKFKNNFDVILVTLPEWQGSIVPKFNCKDANRKMEFAIDFGTTNTHIEYSIDENPAIPLDNHKDRSILQTLQDKQDPNADFEFIDNEITFEQEMLPFVFSSADSEYRFPFRTALVYNQNEKISDSMELFQHINNYFLLEKRNPPLYLTSVKQLKWSNYKSKDTDDETKVKFYIKNLLLLVYYKALYEGADMEKVSVTWFYPVSMDEHELEVFRKLWTNLFKEIFTEAAKNNGLKMMPESIAPYLYYRSEVEGLSVSLDIGGGSSDIAVFDEESIAPKMISSFKFAGNAIFGDGYPEKKVSSNTQKNGFVSAFYEDAAKAVKGDNLKEKILDDIVSKEKVSADFSNFLFALEKEKGSNFNYSRLIQKNRRLKLSIFLFYGAVGYYMAKLLKTSVKQIPGYIMLSGTGSKTATILDPSVDYKNIAHFFEFIFKEVFGKKEATIQFKLDDEPKEITCRGALKGYEDQVLNTPIKFWIGGNKEEKWSKTVDKERDLHATPKYVELDEPAYQDIQDSILDYYRIMDKYVESIRFEEKFMIESPAYKIFKNVRNKGVIDLIKKGKTAFYKENGNFIEETLFFYPLIGILNKVTNELGKKDNK